MIRNRTIAICDILGFSELVNNQKLDIVVDQALGWLHKALFHSLHKNEFPEHAPSLADFQNHEHLGLAWFSDTLLLYSRDDSLEGIREIIQTVGWLLFETILGGGHTRLRCGISYGETYVDEVNGLYVGKPIVEAYQLEQSQEWSGAALTSSAVARIPEMAQSGYYADWMVAPWNVPLKGGLSKQMHVVDWTWGSHLPNFELRWSRKDAEPPPEQWERRPDVCRKWQNTKKFHDQHCRWCNR